MSENIDFNRNEKQLNFNSIKGVVCEINVGNTYSSIVLSVGHERKRDVCFCIATDKLKLFERPFILGDKVNIKFYIASKKKEDRWFTNANIISISLDE
jgi:hypothetical protein